MTEERRFTVDEANGLLPQLSRTLEIIQEAHRKILAGAEPFRGQARSNGGGEQSDEYWKAMKTMRAGLDRLFGAGIILRDAETGLIDFPSEREGQEIFLCWRLGEERVGFWHGPESGFTGRRPL
jgi:hypothetical protein